MLLERLRTESIWVPWTGPGNYFSEQWPARRIVKPGELIVHEKVMFLAKAGPRLILTMRLAVSWRSRPSWTGPEVQSRLKVFRKLGPAALCHSLLLNWLWQHHLRFLRHHTCTHQEAYRAGGKHIWRLHSARLFCSLVYRCLSYFFCCSSSSLVGGRGRTSRQLHQWVKIRLLRRLP